MYPTLFNKYVNSTHVDILYKPDRSLFLMNYMDMNMLEKFNSLIVFDLKTITKFHSRNDLGKIFFFF